MTIKIRRGIFETNSSSTHSISINGSLPPEAGNLPQEQEELLIKLAGSDYILDRSLIPDSDGVLRIDAYKEFGWEQETYHDAGTKAMYCYIDQHRSEKLTRMLKEVLMEQTKAKDVEFAYDPEASWGESRKYGYIDHQSAGTSASAFTDKETLRNFIFNRRCVLETDNDNK